MRESDPAIHAEDGWEWLNGILDYVHPRPVHPEPPEIHFDWFVPGTHTPPPHMNERSVHTHFNLSVKRHLIHVLFE